MDTNKKIKRINFMETYEKFAHKILIPTRFNKIAALGIL